MYAIMIFSVLWQLLLLQIFIIPFDIAVQGGDVENKTTETEHEQIALGTFEHDLHCLKGVNSTWKKDGQTIQTFSNELSLSCVDKSNEGKYTCHAQENTAALKEITVTVKEPSNGKGLCGNPMGAKPFHEQYGNGVSCPSFSQKNYPCCKYKPNPATEMSIKTISSSRISSNRCAVYRGPNNQKNPFDALIEWKLESYGTYGTWGWQIKYVGLEGDANREYCAQINSKEIRKWKVNAKYFLPGARYNITIQTLPELSSSHSSNSIFKIFDVPSLQDMCGTTGRGCNWEFCFPVENLTVTNYSSSPVVSWHPSPFYKSQLAFKVEYYDENRSDWKNITVENGLYNLTLEDLKHKKSGKYFVEVRPLFRDANVDDSEVIAGNSTKLMFYTAVPAAPYPRLDILKMTVAVSVAVICLCLLIILVKIRKKRIKPWSRPSFKPFPQADRPIDVLLVHDGHCKVCNNFTHSLAKVFGETGHINCFLDLCVTNKISAFGLRWYEQQFKNCEKIVVICTKQSKHTYENFYDKGSSNSIYQRSFCLVLSMILGQLSHHNRPQVVPVYLDHSSRDDIPNFLRDRLSYKLPSDIQQLLMSVSDLEARREDVAAEFQLEHTAELQTKISQLRSAAKKLESEHRCWDRKTVCSINYGRSSTHSSAHEPFRV